MRPWPANVFHIVYMMVECQLGLPPITAGIVRAERGMVPFGTGAICFLIYSQFPHLSSSSPRPHVHRPVFCLIHPSSTEFLAMAVPSSSDVFILALGVVLAAIYLFRDQLFAPSKPKAVSLPTKLSEGDGNPRDFIAKMKNGVSTLM
jgi:hypothetical protein